MRIHEILKAKQPDVFYVLCKAFGISEEDLQRGLEESGWFDPAWEMTHDSDDRYLNYTARARRI